MEHFKPSRDRASIVSPLRVLLVGFSYPVVRAVERLARSFPELAFSDQSHPGQRYDLVIKLQGAQHEPAATATLTVDDPELFDAVPDLAHKDARSAQTNLDLKGYKILTLARSMLAYPASHPDQSEASGQIASARLSKRWTMEQKLRSALDNHQFVLDYHPIVDASSARIVGVESLLRWDDPSRGRIYPDDFIPVLEDTAMIIPVGEWVLFEACRQLREWEDSGFTGLILSVNVSPRQLDDRGFARKVERVLESTGIAPESLYLELTENVLLGNDQSIVDTLNSIGKLRVHLIIDDFGTGFSSMNYLKRLPVHGLKIDRSFIAGIPDDASDAAITGSIIELGRNMHLKVIPEGVETLVQAEFLASRGAQMLQGFYFSKPIAPAQITQLLKGGTSLPAQAASIKLDGGRQARDH